MCANLVGISTKDGVRYAFIDYANVKNVHYAFTKSLEKPLFNYKLQVRYRYEDVLPCFDSKKMDKIPELDKKLIHLANLPSNVTKVIFN
jgi:hypothetical protein